MNTRGKSILQVMNDSSQSTSLNCFNRYWFPSGFGWLCWLSQIISPFCLHRCPKAPRIILKANLQEMAQRIFVRWVENSCVLSALTSHTTDVLTISLPYIMQCKKNIVLVINCVLHITLLARIFLKRTNWLHYLKLCILHFTGKMPQQAWPHFARNDNIPT